MTDPKDSKYLKIGSMNGDFEAILLLEQNDTDKVFTLTLNITPEKSFDKKVLKGVEKELGPLKLTDDYNPDCDDEILYMKKALQAILKDFPI